MKKMLFLLASVGFILPFWNGDVVRPAVPPLLVAPAGSSSIPAVDSAAPEQTVDSPRDFRQPVREAVVGLRIASSRAFFGAPPPVRHSIRSELDSRSCLECHALEDRIEKRQHAIAPVPHPEFSQCLQCHVKSGKEVAPFRENEFIGLDLPGRGTRAHPFAPPTIPHKLFLRENCQSCHGPSGKHGLRTPHPERSQCRQCHLPEASSHPWS